MLLAALTCTIFVVTILHFRDYTAAAQDFGDTQAYISVASAIHHWDFHELHVKQFWGYPYAAASVALITHVSDLKAALIVSALSSLISIVLAFRLWGGWVASMFAVLSFDWIQRSYLGGAEPLAIALIFGAFLAIRKDRLVLAALLGALSTVVRPLGIFCLLGIALVLLRRGEFRKLALVILIAATVGALYVLPLTLYFGDPLATVHSYGNSESSLFGFPLYAVIKGTIVYRAPWTNVVLSFGWISIITAGAIMMFRNADFRAYAREHVAEIAFAAPYLLMVYCYNYPVFARSNFARFALPVLPFILLALYKWIPRDRRILWALSAITPILAAASVIGIRNVF